jgi:hypothetical protein
MANDGTEFLPPAWTTGNVLFGVGYLWTATFGTALPADVNLGDSTQWQLSNWSYVGATDQGVSLTFNPSMSNLQIEEQVTPIASLVSTATYQVTLSMAEETINNINLAYGNGGTITQTAANIGTNQPAKSVLALSSNFKTLACAVLGANSLGYPRVFYIPKVNSAGQVQTAFRRAADKRMYPVTLNTLCDLSQIQIIDITGAV